MPFTPTNLQEDINIVINKAKGGGLTKAQITTVLTTISTAQGTDVTVHDTTIETPPAALMPQLPTR
jgi:hypothetical protein